MWKDFAHAFLVVFTALLPVINPPSTALIVLSLLPGADDRQRAGVAARIALYGMVILTTSILIGAYVLAFFGISIPVLRVAGGLVVGAAGWKMLQAPGRTVHNPAAAAVGLGVTVLILSDRAVGHDRGPVPAPPAVSALPHHLGRRAPGRGRESQRDPTQDRRQWR